MKILYLVHQFYPESYTGTEKFILNLSGMVQKGGNQVKVITYSFYDDSFYDRRLGSILIKEFVYKGIPVMAIRHKRVPEDIGHAIDNKELSDVASDIIAAERPDIVHMGHTMRVGPLGQVLPSLSMPYVLTVTDFFLACPKVNLIPSQYPLCNGPEQGAACVTLCPELERSYIQKRLSSARDIIANARLVISPSRFVADIFNQEFAGIAVKVINHGLSFDRLKRNQNSYGNHERLVFCYAGSFNRHKGIHVLLEAFSGLRSSQAYLKIYGSGPDKAYVDELTALAGKNKNVELCGLYPDDKTGEVLSGVDVVVIPSLCYESYSMILHESLACNVPVIATDAGGIAEKIRDGVNGFLFRMGDAKQLQSIMQNITDAPETLIPVKRNIDHMVISGVEEEAWAYMRAYRTICQGETKTVSL